MEIVSNKLYDMAAKSATKAKDGKLKHGGVTYSLTFDHSQWRYNVTDEQGEYVTNFNCKKLSEAKRWLTEWLEN